MNKKFTESIIFLILLNLLVKPIWIFAIDRSIQNRAGAESYGLYFSLFSFSVILNIISDLGISNYNNRIISQNHNQLNIQLSSLIPIRIILGLFYFLISLIFALLIGYSSHQFYLLFWLVFNQLIISFTIYLRTNISGLQKFNTDSFISVIDKLLLIIICAFLLWILPSKLFKIEWFIYAQTFSYSITLLIALYIVLKKSGKIAFEIQLKTSIEILKNSLPYAILMFLMVLYTRIDAVMLERMLPNGKIQVGIYAQAYRITDALAMFAYLFASILLPLFAKMLNDQKPLKDILNHSTGLLIIPSIGLISVLFFNSLEFMSFLYYQHINESSTVLKFLLLGFLGICLNYIYGTLLTASGNLKILNRIAFACLIFNIFLNVILIPKYGPIGAAASNMLTQLTMGLLQVLISYKYFKLQLKLGFITKYIVLIILTIAFSLLIQYFLISWYISIIIIPAFSIVLGFFLGLIQKENFTVIFKKEL